MKSLTVATLLLFIIIVSPFFMISFKTAGAETVFADAFGSENVTTYEDDFSADSGVWQYLGSAYRDKTDQQLVLTTSKGYDGGAAFFGASIQGSFTASFRYKAGGGDGLTMFFYKQEYSSVGDGGSLAFTTSDNEIVPGYGIEFDGWRNVLYDFQLFGEQQINPPQADPSSSHIALIEGFVGNHLVYVNDDRVEDNDWHQVVVEVQASSVTVFVDQEVVLEWNGFLNRTYAGFGFSGGTGSDVGWHIIDDFSISAQELKKPVLTVSCKGSTSFSDFNVQIDGYLTVDGYGIVYEPVLLAYSVNQGKSWNELTLVSTNSEGYYTATWFPSVTGNFLVKATYEGSNGTLGASSEVVNFAVADFETNTLFSVSSNSTVSSLAFNSTTLELSFVVTGPSGTTGYVECVIAKSLVSDPENIRMFLDGNPLNYSLSSKADLWLLYFTYGHSSHRISINLPTNANTDVPTNEEALQTSLDSDLLSSDTIELLIAAAVIIALTCTSLAVYFNKHK